MFNLKRYAQQMPMAPASPSPMDPMMADPMAAQPAAPAMPAVQDDNGATTAQVRELLDGFIQAEIESGVDEHKAKANAVDKAYQHITNELTNPNEMTSDPFSGAQGNSQQAVRDAVNSYYSTAEETEKDRAASLLARTIFPQNGDSGTVDSGEVPAIEQEGVKMNVANFVKQTNEHIKRLAEKHASSSKQVFNLSKQAKALNYEVNLTQDEPFTDSVTGQLITDWHLIRRNEGYGIKLKDWHNLDWEKVWRENVMDKYDPLYIERRFEVDKNIPPTNNMQLSPGEKRRITPPEYGNTEARLESNRTQMNKERGYKPSEKGEPFNWKKAQQAKLAQIGQTPADMGLGNPLKPTKMNKQEWLCHACQNSLEVTDSNSPMDRCTACGALQHGKAIPGKVKTAPDAAKTTAPTGTGSVPIHASEHIEVEKLASKDGGIFFDSNDLKFVVVAGKKKKKFDTYYEAEEFKMLVQDPSAASPKAQGIKQRTQLSPQQIARQREIANHADGLGIDG